MTLLSQALESLFQKHWASFGPTVINQASQGSTGHLYSENIIQNEEAPP